MQFQSYPNVWRVTFLDADLKTALSRTFHFSDSDKVTEMARRGGAVLTSEGRQMLEYAIGKGGGAVWLNLDKEQHEMLKRVRKSERLPTNL